MVLVGGGEALLACKGKLNEIVSEYNLHYGMNTNGVNLDKFNNKNLLKIKLGVYFYSCRY